ncbi:MAG: diadenosine tetraphosphatase [Verrucomicrobiaceae bacterium]|nr:MAG: diadenosine tetraphosphatase [Verrucomicrobiaceae bacterium]
MKNGPRYDIIADIHGRIDKLTRLLDRLGYSYDGISHVPPPGLTALFLGDLIDPKPGHAIPGGVCATLEAVKAMADRGHALVLMGNHELNAIHYHTKGLDDQWLRRHDDKNRAMHQGTLDDFPDHEEPAGEWLNVWIPWMKRLPIFLELDGLRAVHASWHSEHLQRLNGRTLEDDDFLRDTANPTTADGAAIEAILKGIEVPLPDGVDYFDHTGIRRRNFRARWWEKPSPGTLLDDLVFPANPQVPNAPIPEEAISFFQPYPNDAVPVFVGHYFKPAESPLRPERCNVAVLDHSAAKNGPLVAYRWQGERRICSSHYVTHA